MSERRDSHPPGQQPVLSEKDTQATPVLYFDLGSPYAYLAVERAASVLGAEPILEPVLLGAIFQKRGFGSWSATASREPRVAEIAGRAARYGLPPMRWPAAWPANGLCAMRCATWAKQNSSVAAFARAVYRRHFGEGADIADASVLRASAADADLDGEQMLRAAERAETKHALRDATEAAWRRGVRGVPSLLVGDAVFYGDDQLELGAASMCASAGSGHP
jgi:2-hydroxychromene-2-carboxylate isomerase